MELLGIKCQRGPEFLNLHSYSIFYIDFNVRFSICFALVSLLANSLFEYLGPVAFGILH